MRKKEREREVQKIIIIMKNQCRKNVEWDKRVKSVNISAGVCSLMVRRPKSWGQVAGEATRPTKNFDAVTPRLAR